MKKISLATLCLTAALNLFSQQLQEASYRDFGLLKIDDILIYINENKNSYLKQLLILDFLDRGIVQVFRDYEQDQTQFNKYLTRLKNKRNDLYEHYFLYKSSSYAKIISEYRLLQNQYKPDRIKRLLDDATLKPSSMIHHITETIVKLKKQNETSLQKELETINTERQDGEKKREELTNENVKIGQEINELESKIKKFEKINALKASKFEKEKFLKDLNKKDELSLLNIRKTNLNTIIEFIKTYNENVKKEKQKRLDSKKAESTNDFFSWLPDSIKEVFTNADQLPNDLIQKRSTYERQITEIVTQSNLIFDATNLITDDLFNLEKVNEIKLLLEAELNAITAAITNNAKAIEANTQVIAELEKQIQENMTGLNNDTSDSALKNIETKLRELKAQSEANKKEKKVLQVQQNVSKKIQKHKETAQQSLQKQLSELNYKNYATEFIKKFFSTTEQKAATEIEKDKNVLIKQSEKTDNLFSFVESIETLSHELNKLLLLVPIKQTIRFDELAATNKIIAPVNSRRLAKKMLNQAQNKAEDAKKSLLNFWTAVKTMGKNNPTSKQAPEKKSKNPESELSKDLYFDLSTSGPLVENVAAHIESVFEMLHGFLPSMNDVMNTHNYLEIKLIKLLYIDPIRSQLEQLMNTIKKVGLADKGKLPDLQNKLKTVDATINNAITTMKETNDKPYFEPEIIQLIDSKQLIQAVFKTIANQYEIIIAPIANKLPKDNRNQAMPKSTNPFDNLDTQTENLPGGQTETEQQPTNPFDVPIMEWDVLTKVKLSLNHLERKVNSITYALQTIFNTTETRELGKKEKEAIIEKMKSAYQYLKLQMQMSIEKAVNKLKDPLNLATEISLLTIENNQLSGPVAQQADLIAQLKSKLIDLQLLRSPNTVKNNQKSNFFETLTNDFNEMIDEHKITLFGQWKSAQLKALTSVLNLMSDIGKS
ncbi:hypothetical protein IPH25_01560 [bacterium]|nr:MAG: hypothetical protein IPG37_03690 [bacterium]QQR62113.1 MAG: hypothetical protein IPH25_01560 [bacterium]